MNELGYPVLGLKSGIDNNIDFTNTATINQRRGMEMLTINTSQGSEFIFDVRDQIFEQAGLGMLLTLFAIFIFSVSTLFVNSGTMSLVVAPIARLTDLLIKMTGVIGLLGDGQVCTCCL